MTGADDKSRVAVSVLLIAAVRPVEAFVHSQGNAVRNPCIAVCCGVGAARRVKVKLRVHVGRMDVVAQRCCCVGDGHRRFATGQLQGVLALGARLVRPRLQAAAHRQSGFYAVNGLLHAGLLGAGVIDHILDSSGHIHAARGLFVLDRDDRHIACSIHDRDTEVHGRACDGATAGRGGRVDVDVVSAVLADGQVLHQLTTRVGRGSLCYLFAVHKEVRGLAHAGADRGVADAERGSDRVQRGFRQCSRHGNGQDGNCPCLGAGRAVFIRNHNADFVVTGNQPFCRIEGDFHALHNVGRCHLNTVDIVGSSAAEVRVGIGEGVGQLGCLALRNGEGQCLFAVDVGFVRQGNAGRTTGAAATAARNVYRVDNVLLVFIVQVQIVGFCVVDHRAERQPARSLDRQRDGAAVGVGNLQAIINGLNVLNNAVLDDFLKLGQSVSRCGCLKLCGLCRCSRLRGRLGRGLDVGRCIGSVRRCLFCGSLCFTGSCFRLGRRGGCGICSLYGSLGRAGRVCCGLLRRRCGRCSSGCGIARLDRCCAGLGCCGLGRGHHAFGVACRPLGCRCILHSLICSSDGRGRFALSRCSPLLNVANGFGHLLRGVFGLLRCGLCAVGIALHSILQGFDLDVVGFVFRCDKQQVIVQSVSRRGEVLNAFFRH